MIKKRLLLIYFLFFQLILFSQNKPLLIKGFTKDSLGVVKDANVWNLSTGKGTFSSEEGSFEIFASEGDSIKISSIPHETKTLVFSKQNFKEQTTAIYLTIKVTVLDEFELKQNNLTGSLFTDVKNVPTKIRDSILADNMNYIINAKKGKLIPDIIDTKVKPPPNDVDPISGSAPRSSGGIGMPLKSLRKERAKKAHLNFIRAFPKKLLTDLGNDFFFVQLKIPKERYYHFLEFCNPLGIEKKYKNGKALEVIEILRNESVGYLKIINKTN